jgi:hypothetical protein
VSARQKDEKTHVETRKGHSLCQYGAVDLSGVLHTTGGTSGESEFEGWTMDGMDTRAELGFRIAFVVTLRRGQPWVDLHTIMRRIRRRTAIPPPLQRCRIHLVEH